MIRLSLFVKFSTEALKRAFFARFKASVLNLTKRLRMKAIYIFFIVFALCLEAATLDIEVSARSAILMNAETGAILYEKKAHVPSFAGSSQKIATILFAIDGKKADFDRFVSVSAEAVKIKPLKDRDKFPAHWGEPDGTRMRLLKGETLSLRSLFHGAMLISGNDAANAIAESLSTSIPDFMTELNEYVQSLGCTQTQLLNPHGLYHPENFTTAFDLCLITKKALQVPQFRELFSKTVYHKPKTNKQAAEEIRHTNALLKPGKHYYPKAIGSKTGYHRIAQYTIAAAAEQDGRTLIAVLLGCPDRAIRYQDAIRLFESAFAEELQTRVFVAAEQQFTQAIEGAKQPLQASLAKDVAVSFFPAEEPSCKAFIKWDTLSLPVRKGQKVGEVQLYDQEKRLLSAEALLAKEDVFPTWMFKMKKFFWKG